MGENYEMLSYMSNITFIRSTNFQILQHQLEGGSNPIFTGSNLKDVEIWVPWKWSPCVCESLNTKGETITLITLLYVLISLWLRSLSQKWNKSLKSLKWHLIQFLGKLNDIKKTKESEFPKWVLGLNLTHWLGLARLDLGHWSFRVWPKRG